MKTVKTTVWDPADYLKTDDEIAAYLYDVFSTNDSQLIVAAIGDIARAKGMSKIADDVDCGRESLYKSLSQNGNPSFETVIKVLKSLGYVLRPANVSGA
ncbi:MAG: putative addiction module antidote protein [Clostridiales bacterium]|nr:putative addiction module antidote protein [Clostridiales bacterium]